MSVLSYKETQAIIEIVKKFDIVDGKVEWIIPIDSGHINTTYKVVVNTGEDTFSYLLQCINNNVFKKPYEVMENALRITKHIMSQGKKTIKFIKKKGVWGNTSKDYIYENYMNFLGENPGVCVRYWRVSEFIHSEVFQSITKKEDMYMLGNVICDFCKSLGNFDAKILHETIPDFHDTKKRFEILIMSVLNAEFEIPNNQRVKSKKVQEAVNFTIKRREKFSIIIRMLEMNEIPYRVTHNDPKLNNILFDRKTNLPICLIDLDTVMSGSILWDIGDAIRSGANTISKDSMEYERASLDMELYCEFVKGCIDTNFLTEKEYELIPDAVWIITMELGIRYLTDYIEGDKYFAIKYEHQNLIKAWVHFYLAIDIERKLDEMRAFIKQYRKK